MLANHSESNTTAPAFTRISREPLARTGFSPRFWVYQLSTGSLTLEILSDVKPAPALVEGLRALPSDGKFRRSAEICSDSEGSNWRLVEVVGSVADISQAAAYVASKGYLRVEHHDDGLGYDDDVEA